MSLPFLPCSNHVCAHRYEQRVSLSLPHLKAGIWRPPSYRPRLSNLCARALSDQLSASSSAGTTRQFSVPLTVEESIEQAVYACKQARRDGLTKLQLELLLPLIGATDLDDWPGGIQQQFKAASPVVSKLLQGLIDTQELAQENTVKTYILDDGDAVGVWESERVVLVLFPNADCLEKVRSFDNVSGRLSLLVNPQWQGGQVISDFGFGAQRKLREEFVATFNTVYYLKQLRILGEDVRILKCYPGICSGFKREQ